MKPQSTLGWFTSPPLPSPTAAHPTPCQLYTSVQPRGDTSISLPPGSLFTKGRVGETRENRESIFLGKRGDRYRSTEILQPFSRHFLLTRRRKYQKSHKQAHSGIFFFFFYSVFIYFTFFAKPLSTNSNRPASRPPRGSPITKYC